MKYAIITPAPAHQRWFFVEWDVLENNKKVSDAIFDKFGSTLSHVAFNVANKIYPVYIGENNKLIRLIKDVTLKIIDGGNVVEDIYIINLDKFLDNDSCVVYSPAHILFYDSDSFYIYEVDSNYHQETYELNYNEIKEAIEQLKNKQK